MSRDPIRLEPLLTRDYIDRAAKMRELQPRSQAVSAWDLVATWLIVGAVLVWVWVAW